MKIDGNNLNPESAAAKRLDRTQADGAVPAAPDPGGRGDRVQLSADAALAKDAIEAAKASPAIRQDVVERARKALEAGTLGADADALANTLIDRMLDEE